MKKGTLYSVIVLITLLLTLVVNTPVQSEFLAMEGVKGLQQDSIGDVEITQDPRTGRPSFIRGQFPVSLFGSYNHEENDVDLALSFASHYADIFGLRDVSDELILSDNYVDGLGIKHLTLAQVYKNVEVFGASMKIHISADGQYIMAVSSSIVPGIRLPSTSPEIGAEDALEIAERTLLRSIPMAEPNLVIYPGKNSVLTTSAVLSWVVELIDDSLPARNLYIVDAHDGMILDVINRLYENSVEAGDVVDQISVYNTAFLTDTQLEDYESKDVAMIRAFLTIHDSYFKEPIQDVDGQTFDPVEVIFQAANQYRINPNVLLATLEKEHQGVTTQSRPSNDAMSFLMGCISSSTAREQIICAAERFRAYHDQLTDTGSTVSGWSVGVPKMTQDGVVVTPATKAIAGQFTYTPYAGVQWGGNDPQWGGVYLFYAAWNKFGFYINRYRETYNANHRYTLPGTLARSEFDAPVGDQDIDNAHDFAGATYDYLFSTHGRDSYDNYGAKLNSTAHYGTSYINAFWNGEQLVYGDGFAVKDVVAHEITHAVTEYSANLEYRWQSGALNESFSDIFGAMVDRDDWLMGEDLSPSLLGGRDAIRDLSDPTRFGQPAHTDDWVATCSDEEGVHTNSGITNKAYYEIANNITKEKAELIFYRALTVYLDSSSSLEDARAATLQSTQDLYGDQSEEYIAVRDGFNSVGLDGLWNPPANDCICVATIALSDQEVFTDPVSALEGAITLYRLRDQLMKTTIVGQHYLNMYDQYTGRISQLLIANADLRLAAGGILQTVTPGLSQLVTGVSESDIVTSETISEVKNFLVELAEEDRENGGGELSDTIELEMTRINWDELIGKTYVEAWDYLQSHVVYFYSIYFPAVISR